MRKVIDNYIHKDIAEEVYEGISTRFSLKDYSSTCCFDSKLGGGKLFDYEAEASFLFGQYVDITETAHHFFINSFSKDSYVLGPHKPGESGKLIKSKDGEFTSSIKKKERWREHLLLLIHPEGNTTGGDFFFREGEAPEGQSPNSDFSKVEFRNNRLLITDPNKERLMSYIESSPEPMLHINLLY